MSRPKKEFNYQGDNQALKDLQNWLDKSNKDWEALSKGAEIERQVISTWLNGHKIPSINSWNKISIYTKIPIKRFLKGTQFHLGNDNNFYEHKINELMQLKGMTASEIYNNYDIPKNTVHNIIRGEQPQYKTLVKFIKVLGVSTAYDLIKLKK